MTAERDAILPTSQREIAKVEHYRSGMLRRFGPLYHLTGLGRVFRHLELDERSVENIRTASEQGPVVYVLRTASAVDWLALNRALNHRRLPLATVTVGVRGVWFRPLEELWRGAWRGLKRRLMFAEPPDPIGSGAWEDALRRGEPTAIFLVNGLSGRPTPGLTDALLRAQEVQERPIQLVPIVVLWQRDPGAARGEVGRVLMGHADEPGPLQKLYTVATHEDTVRVQAGRSVSLAEFRSRYSGEGVARVGRRLTILLRRYLYRESRVVQGPRIRSHRWTRRLVVESPEIRRLIQEEALATGRTEERLHAEVLRTYDRIAARFSYWTVRASRWLIGLVWERIFSGIDVREADLERLREALRAGTPILIPCHRSHLDYLLISSVCYEHGIVIPHIVAGENLSFFPLGWLFRRLGAFFIKRKFGDDRIFPAVFARYLQQLIRDGFPVEFFIEGGRSRTGKLLPPKLGVLSMVLDAAAGMRPDQEVTLLPVAITYDQVAEDRVYARELAGAPKHPEDLRQVVRARRIFWRRMGRVYLRVGEPLSSRGLFAEQPQPWSQLPREARQEVLQQIGERVMFRIAQDAVLVPTALVAMALLARSRRGIRHAELLERTRRLDALLRARGASPGATMVYGGGAVEEALSRFQQGRLIDRLEDEAGPIIQILEEKRITLEYYKNGLLHFVAPPSLLAAAVLAVGRPFAPEDGEVFRLFRLQVFLLRYELTLDPEQPLERLAAESLSALLHYGALRRPEAEGALLEVCEDGWLRELAGLTRNLLESYRLVLQAARAMRSGEVPWKELPRRIQVYGKGRLAVDELRRPEALSLVNLENAVRAYREEGVIQGPSAGGGRRGEGLQFDATGGEQYLGDLERLLGDPQ